MAQTVHNHKVGDLCMGMKSVNLRVIVLHVGDPQVVKGGQTVKACKVADQTGSVELSLWSPWCDSIQESDILQLTNCYMGVYSNRLVVYVGRSGSVAKVGEFTMLYAEMPNISEIITDPSLPPNMGPDMRPIRPSTPNIRGGYNGNFRDHRNPRRGQYPRPPPPFNR
ncbi:SOSS complex subunit B1-like [Bolinopsis microptera]|uniref:SOSS complex subunit B1-like n=1 Tax=Bolinopsis microptera TaxID=2820187 RepID=UPI003078FEE2